MIESSRRLPRLLLAALILMLAGCLTNPHGERPKELVYQTQIFEDTVRWGALENIVLFVKLEEGQPVEIPEGLDNIRVTSYELARPLTKVDETRWDQTAVIDYVLTDRQIVRRLVDYQIWETDDEGKSWYRANPVPEFR